MKFIVKKAFKEKSDDLCPKFIFHNHQPCELG